MADRDSVFLMPGNIATGWQPYVARTEDLTNFDTWPSEQVTLSALTAIREIIDLGFEGIRSDSFRAGEGRFVGDICTNIETPEGRLCETLLAFASKGVALPPGDAVAILKRIYREQGLPLPTKNKPGV